MPLLLFFLPVGVAFLLLLQQRRAALGAIDGGALFAISGDDDGNPTGSAGAFTIYPAATDTAQLFAGIPQISAPNWLDPVLGELTPSSSMGTIGRLAVDSGALSAGRTAAWSVPARAAGYAEPIAAAEQRHGLPANLLARVLQEESGYNPTARSSAGALGIAQLMPGTARDLGVDPLSPFASIDAAAKYLRQLYDKTGTWALALAAYNWGIGNLQRQGIARAPAETRKYVARITADVPA